MRFEGRVLVSKYITCAVQTNVGELHAPFCKLFKTCPDQMT